MTFRSALADALSMQGLNATQYSVKLGHSTSGLVYQVLNADKPVPLNKLDAWLAALDLPPSAEKRLRLLALQEFAPDYVLKLINAMRFESQAYMNLVYQAAQEKGINLPAPPDLFADMEPEAEAPRSPAARKRAN